MFNPQQHHKHALKCLLRFLNGTRTHGLWYPKQCSENRTESLLTVYSNADFADEQNRKSVTGTVHCLSASPTSWTSQKQNLVAVSTTKAEYIAPTNARHHTSWLTNLLQDTYNGTIRIFIHHIDNCSAMMIAENQAPTKQRKYIAIISCNKR